MQQNAEITSTQYQGALDALEGRRFDESLALAEQVLGEARDSTWPVEQQVQALHLLADIHNHKGRYLNIPFHHEQALTYLSEAASLQKGSRLFWENDLRKAHTYIFLREFPLAWEILQGYSHRSQTQPFPERLNLRLALAYSSYHYAQNEYEEANQSIGQALVLLDEEAAKELWLEVYAQALKIAQRRYDFDELHEYASKVLEWAAMLGDKERESVGLNALAVYHGARQEYKIAMLHFRNALDKSMEINYRYGIANCLINIGTIYAYLLNYEEALERYKTVLDEYEDVLLDENTEIIILNNVGNIHFTVGRTDEARAYFERSLALADAIGYQGMRAHAMAQISRTLLAQGKMDDALQYAKESEVLLEEYGTAEGKQINYITLGNIYYEREAYDTAVQYVDKGLVCAREVRDVVYEIRGYRLMSNIFKAKGNFEKALDYQLIYSQAQEKQALEQRNRQIIDLEMRYDFQKKEKELELLKKYKDKLLAQQQRIVEQNKQLKEANTDLTQFAYAVSHDLKEPLRMIGSYIQLVQRRNEEKLDGDSHEFLRYVNEGVYRMNQLLDDLLKYATIGRGVELDWEEVDLSKVAEITSFNLEVAIKEAQATIIADDLPVVMGNRSYMMQLFQNFVSNAIKFRREGVPPEVHIEYQDKGQNHCLIFQDNGIGMPMDALERIFLVFQRLHKRVAYSGSGIGLSICMKIVKRLGGHINVESEQGQGSRFTICLPKEYKPNRPLEEEEGFLDF